MAVAEIDDELDRLYGLPLDEFTRERNALAKRLRSEGRRDDAASVAELRKPVVAAWVVNRLAREREDEVQELIDAADAIRAGAVGGDERLRAAVEELMHAARGVLEDGGRRASDATLRDVATTLRAAPVSEPELLRSGRLTEPVEPTGFEAMAGAAAAEGRPARRRQSPQRPDRARVREAREALSAAREEARKLGRAADAAEREARDRRAEADAADSAVAEAEAALAELS